jgi:hypothetical protein
MRRSKIFGIGLSRTGTTSLTEALAILGFSAIHYPTSLEQIELYDAATDLLVAATFEMLDAKFPGSKFIYTVRRRESWLESCRRHWLRRQEKVDDINRELRKQLYGTIDFDADLFAQAYDRHETHVLHYFAERPHDFLVFDICGGRTDWERLCSFLSAPVPIVPFPNTNRLDVLDDVLIRLLHAIGDAEQVAKIAKVSTQYVEDLRSSDAFRNRDVEALLSYDGNQGVDGVLKRACSYFGSIDSAATELKLPRACLESAMVRRHRRKRTRLFKEFGLNLRRFMTGASMG